MNFCPHCGRRLGRKRMEGRQRPFCQGCQVAFYQDPKLAVAVVIALDGKVLLGQRAMNPGKGAWSLPSGFVDRGEKVEEAAVREVKEETSLEVRLEKLLGLYSEPGNPVVLAAYTGQIGGGSLTPGSDLTELAFFAPDDLPPLAFPQDRQIIAEGLRSLRAAEG